MVGGHNRGRTSPFGRALLPIGLGETGLFRLSVAGWAQTTQTAIKQLHAENQFGVDPLHGVVDTAPAIQDQSLVEQTVEEDQNRRDEVLPAQPILNTQRPLVLGLQLVRFQHRVVALGFEPLVNRFVIIVHHL